MDPLKGLTDFQVHLLFFLINVKEIFHYCCVRLLVELWCYMVRELSVMFVLFFDELVFEFGFHVTFQVAEHGRVYGRNG